MAEHIEREALLEDIDAAQKNGGMGEVVAGTLKRYVKRQPAADVAPVRHGQWMEMPSMEPEYECSACGRTYAWWEPSEAHFCPGCGARMEGGTDNG